MSVIQQSHTKQRISQGIMQGRIYRASSVYGGAGGFGTQTSQSTRFCSAGTSFGWTYVIMDRKLTMKNLNERLASYLETVRTLEAKKKELELNISEFCVQEVAPRDLAGYFAIISELREQIMNSHSENDRLTLQIDNCKMAAEDFKLRYDMELSVRNSVEADITRLSGMRDSLTISISNLEMNVEGLREELVIMRNSHKEEIYKLQIELKEAGNVKVEVDAPDSTDLKQVLEEMREQYELVVKNNKLDIEKWYHSKMKILEAQILVCKTEVETFYKQLLELKRTYQSLEISRKCTCAKIQCLQVNVTEVKEQYAMRLFQQQEVIVTLEKELQQLQMTLRQVQVEYSGLLELKSRLEKEIIEYRRLLDGEFCEEKKQVVITKVTQEVQDQRPHIEKRVKTIVENLVDGQVVSSSVDTQVETVQ